MADLDGKWLLEFDRALQKYLAITRDDAGISDEVASRYAVLSPFRAALQYGEDYDLQRIDIDWLS